MKMYPFVNRESCQKFLTCLDVQVNVPSEESLFYKHLNAKIVYEVWMEGKTCYKAVATDGARTYVFYRSSDFSKSTQKSNRVSNEINKELRDTVTRLRLAYQSIHSKGGKP